MIRTPFAILLAAALGLGLSACDGETSPTAPSAKGSTPDPRHDAKVVGTWFSTSTFENETREFLADSSLRVVIDALENGKVVRYVLSGSWFSDAGKLTLRFKSATKSANGGAAVSTSIVKPQFLETYVVAGDSLVVTENGERDVYRKGTAPAFVAPPLKEQVVGSWKALEIPYESKLDILAGGSYKQTTKYPTTSGGYKWSLVEGTWAVAGNTLVFTQVKVSDSDDGKTWTVADDVILLVEEWPVTIPDSETMNLKGDMGEFGYERL